MRYVKMTVKEASKLIKEDVTVLVCVSDLEAEDCNEGFEKKKFGECKEMINDAKTIAKVCDDFVNQLRLFSIKQENVINYDPIGKLGIILFKCQERCDDCN